MAEAEAELVGRLPVRPGEWLDTWHAPWVAGAARPGRYVHVRTPARWAVPLRRPYTINTYDRAAGLLTLHVRASTPGGEWLARLRPSDRLGLSGPLGRGFDVDERSRHLLLVASAAGMTGVRALADEGVAAGRRIVVLLGASSAADVYPSSLLPDEVEYVVATEDGSIGHRGPVTDLVADYEAWADQCFASGPLPLLEALALAARGRDERLGVARLGRKPRARAASPSARTRRRAWLQVLVDQEVGCALGTCLGCVVEGAAGPVRACREGPAFASTELAWSELS